MVTATTTRGHYLITLSTLIPVKLQALVYDIPESDARSVDTSMSRHTIPTELIDGKQLFMRGASDENAVLSLYLLVCQPWLVGLPPYVVLIFAS